MPVITTSNTDSIPGTVLHGTVHGGQNPIAGAHVYLYAINTTGYGGPGIAASTTNASVSLLHTGTGTTQDGSGHYYVTTDPYGNFTITSDYSCPSNYPNTYFYASGGDPGLGSGSKLGHHPHGPGAGLQYFRLHRYQRSLDHRHSLRLRRVRKRSYAHLHFQHQCSPPQASPMRRTPWPALKTST